MNKIGYRTEDLYGEGYRDAAAVMAHETFELENDDIPETLSTTILKGTEIGEKLANIVKAKENPSEMDPEIEEFLDAAFEDDEIGINFYKEVLEEIKKVTGKDIKYVLWLCDSIKDIKDEYEWEDMDIELNNFDEYETSDVILSDMGTAGKLYGYETEPSPI